jgi:hypothetical protein
MEFLSTEWFSAGAARLRAAAEQRPASGAPIRVQFEFSHAPADGVQSLALVVDNQSMELRPGEIPGADVRVRMDYADGAALFAGELSSSRALRDGRLKVRGDVAKLLTVFTRLRSTESASATENQPGQ